MKKRTELILSELFKTFPELGKCRSSIETAFNILVGCYSQGEKVLVCGNGGSAADSEHIVGELMKGFLLKRRIPEKDVEKLKKNFPGEWERISCSLQGALPAISLVSHTSFYTAFANDVSPDMCFAQQVYGYGREGDVLVGISTSGNSKNVVNAIKVAEALGLKTIGLTGEDGGQMGRLCNAVIRVPATGTPRVQEYHLPVYHGLCAMLESEFFEE